jgi:hypothetical protein
MSLEWVDQNCDVYIALIGLSEEMTKRRSTVREETVVARIPQNEPGKYIRYSFVPPWCFPIC